MSLQRAGGTASPHRNGVPCLQGFTSLPARRRAAWLKNGPETPVVVLREGVRSGSDLQPQELLILTGRDGELHDHNRVVRNWINAGIGRHRGRDVHPRGRIRGVRSLMLNVQPERPHILTVGQSEENRLASSRLLA